MKKIFLGVLFIALMAPFIYASYDNGGKKKAKKKAKVECKKDIKDSNCDPKDCCPPVCLPAPQCTGSK